MKARKRKREEEEIRESTGPELRKHARHHVVLADIPPLPTRENTPLSQDVINMALNLLLRLKIENETLVKSGQEGFNPFKRAAHYLDLGSSTLYDLWVRWQRRGFQAPPRSTLHAPRKRRSTAVLNELKGEIAAKVKELKEKGKHVQSPLIVRYLWKQKRLRVTKPQIGHFLRRSGFVYAKSLKFQVRE